MLASVVHFSLHEQGSDGYERFYFPGGEGGPQHGYLYHSGGPLAHRPGDTNAYFLHLTNGWYEY